MALTKKIEVVSSLDSVKQQEVINAEKFIELAKKVQLILKKEAQDARDTEEDGDFIVHPA